MTSAGLTTQPTGEERWWKLLRRAFGVPDIVSDGNREAAVAHALLEGVPIPDETSDFEKRLSSYDPDAPQRRQVDDARSVVATIAKMGGAGELDELFFVGHRRPDENALRKLAIGRTGPLETEGLIDKVFRVVTGYVADRPFED